LLWHDRRVRHYDICLYLGAADRTELQALLSIRNTARKLAWWAGIVLATAEGSQHERQYPEVTKALAAE